jgi:hypothetical protein
MTPQEFVRKWQGATLTERQAAQSHWNDLCAMLDRPKPADADQTGDTYCFEKGVRKSGGGQGWADVWFKNHFAVEYKGPKEKDLRRAYDQLQRYHDWLGHPPLLIVTDTQRFEVHTKFTRTAPRVFRFTLDDLLSAERITVETNEHQPPELTAFEVLQAAFDNPDRLKPTLTTDRVTKDASANFATIAQSMRDRGINPHKAAHFLMKALFCLFAEDVGLLPPRLFERLLDSERRDPPALRDAMDDLFAAMRDGRRFGADRIKHFNGALFDAEPAIELTREEIEALRLAAKLDWAHVEPSIFGTLFERSLDPDQRAQLGAHYTGFDDIMLVVEPVILRPLRREWDELRESLAPRLTELEELRDKLAKGGDRAKAERRFKKLRSEVDKAYSALLERLRTVRILDPACGSGNFLYVALEQVKDLEKQIIQEAFALGLDLTQQTPMVDPSRLYGMELNPYAHELAQVVVWIGYIQWHVRNNYSFPENPILKPLTNIRRMDALLRSAGVPPAPAVDVPSTAPRSAGVPPAPSVDVPSTADAGKMPASGASETLALRPEWPEAEFVIGNPPFLGGNKIRKALGDEYVDTLFKAYEGDVAPFADLSVYWHERARALIAEGKVRRAGLLATQGIRGGANQRTLKRILETGNIFDAWSDKQWTLGGAAVQISIVCQDDGTETERRLDGVNVSRIHADLTRGASVDLTLAKRLVENQGIACYGSQQKGSFDISSSEAEAMLCTPNPHGRPTSDVVKLAVNGRQLIQSRDYGWVIDFGLDMPMEEAAQYEALFEHVRRVVLPERANRREVRQRTHWWLHARPSPNYRQIIQSQTRYPATVCVSKYRLFVWLTPDILADHALVVFAREDDYFFGVLHSVVHECWALRLGTQLESRPRYTPTTCFETFPFPWPPRDVGVPPAPGGGTPPELIGEDADATLRQAIAQAANELNQLRENWLNPNGLTEAELKKRTLTRL